MLQNKTRIPSGSLGLNKTVEKLEHCHSFTVVFWWSIIGQKIFTQNRGFMIGKVVRIMISED